MSHSHSHSHSHRRLPSAPIAVFPTHTPGLLTLSKPLPQQGRDAQVNPQSKKLAHKLPPLKGAARNKSHHPRDAHHQHQQTAPTTPAAQDVAATVPVPVTAIDQTAQRGRSGRSSPKQHRSSSQPRPKDPDAAAPTPDDATPAKSARKPRPQSTRVPATTPAPTEPIAQPASSPALGPPSGKLARNRRARHKSLVFPEAAPVLPPVVAPTRTPSPRNQKAIPVPIPHRPTSPRLNISRSAPLAVADWDVPLKGLAIDLPADDRERLHELQARAALDKLLNVGPRTAPLSATQPSFPSFSPPPSPTIHRARSGRPKHQRAPSQPLETMMFSMEAEDVTSQVTGPPFLAMASASAPTTPQRQRPRRNNTVGPPSLGPGINLISAFSASSPAVLGGTGKKNMWAGSAFQNAPDAADLPIPSFFGQA